VAVAVQDHVVEAAMVQLSVGQLQGQLEG
jgi:hypothetical protein